jgi:transglutaminase-like putative cysteine protease
MMPQHSHHRDKHSAFAAEIANKPRSAAHNGSFLLITVLFSAVCMTLFASIDLFILFIAVMALSMRVLLYFGKYQHVPNTLFINLVAIISGGYLVYASMELPLLRTMINLLVLASSLKIMVLNTQKDLLAIFLALLFLTTLGIIHQPHVLFLLFYLVIIGALLLCLAMHFAPKQRMRQRLKQLGILVAQSLPICALLFVLLPPLPPFWEMPQPQSNSTGLTDVIKPGSIASLAKSTDLAFSASFADPQSVPKYHERYWPALTLDTFDGAQWTSSEDEITPRLQSAPEAEPQSALTAKATRDSHYRVFLLPNDTRYLPSLAMPLSMSATNPHIYVTANATVAALIPLTRTSEYSVTSRISASLSETAAQRDITRYVQIPTSMSNPKTQAWVAAQHLNNVYQWVAFFNNYLLDQNFQYTLEPPLMTEDGIDAFLFEHRTGFCSHYASAMGYVLRLAGYPTRLVAGYQGGETVNDNTMLIYQYDAHAWLEVLTPDQGWLRLDPTATIAPTRVRQNLLDALTERQEDTSWAGMHHHLRGEWQQAMHAQMRYWQTKWQANLLSFDKADHQHLVNWLLNALHLDNVLILGVLGLIMIGLSLGLYSLWTRRQKYPTDPVLAYYVKAKQHCIKRLGERSTLAASNMPPHTFQKWVMDQHTRLGVALLPLSNALEKHLYQGSKTVNIEDVKDAWRQLKRI